MALMFAVLDIYNRKRVQYSGVQSISQEAQSTHSSMWVTMQLRTYCHLVATYACHSEGAQNTRLTGQVCTANQTL